MESSISSVNVPVGGFEIPAIYNNQFRIDPGQNRVVVLVHVLRKSSHFEIVNVACLLDDLPK